MRFTSYISELDCSRFERKSDCTQICQIQNLMSLKKFHFSEGYYIQKITLKNGRNDSRKFVIKFSTILAIPKTIFYLLSPFPLLEQK